MKRKKKTRTKLKGIVNSISKAAKAVSTKYKPIVLKIRFTYFILLFALVFHLLFTVSFGYAFDFVGATFFCFIIFI